MNGGADIPIGGREYLKVSVRGCQRCGADHEGMMFSPLDNPADEYAWWGQCPATGQPVMLAVVDDVPADGSPYDLATSATPIHDWFELSYASFLTVPRLVMQSMPIAWQRRMVALLVEMDATFDWRPPRGRYWVRLRDDLGRFSEAPLWDYRRGSAEHLRRGDR